MKTITFEQSKKDFEAIVSVNAAFHDIEAEFYKDKHPEIYDHERKSWTDLFSRIEARKDDGTPHARKILDVGSGVGFVPLAISSSLRSQDTIVLSDISQTMLDYAVKNCSSLPCKVETRLIRNGYAEVESESVDIVTLNSVLHHIPDIKSFFAEIERILKPGGVLVIKHEPNIGFSSNFVLRNIFLFLRSLQKVGNNKKPVSKNDVIYQRTIDLLESRGIVFEPKLTRSELQAIVDIHSPTAAGSMDSTRGFAPYEFTNTYLHSSIILECNTYGYFGKIRDDATFLRKFFSAILRKCFPKGGYFFDVVIQKTAS
jgi:ubiquinone/menaquinone biosynthesis C-methylase UbiE